MVVISFFPCAFPSPRQSEDRSPSPSIGTRRNPNRGHHSFGLSHQQWLKLKGSESANTSCTGIINPSSSWRYWRWGNKLTCLNYRTYKWQKWSLNLGDSLMKKELKVLLVPGRKPMAWDAAGRTRNFSLNIKEPWRHRIWSLSSNPWWVATWERNYPI